MLTTSVMSCLIARSSMRLKVRPPVHVDPQAGLSARFAGLEYGKLQPANFNAPGRSSDFALWKRSSRDEIACWDSPWGTGRPGWHIECSAMSTSAVGPDLDVHSGGIDVCIHRDDDPIAILTPTLSTVEIPSSQ